MWTLWVEEMLLAHAAAKADQVHIIALGKSQILFPILFNIFTF